MMSYIEGTYRLETFLKIMLENILPSKVIVYGAMQNDILEELLNKYEFIRFPSEIELAYNNENKQNGYDI